MGYHARWPDDGGGADGAGVPPCMWCGAKDCGGEFPRVLGPAAQAYVPVLCTAVCALGVA